MQLIRCTQKLLKELKVKPSDENPKFGYIGGWHANLLRIERRKCVLFTNDATLYSIFVPGLKKPDFEHLDEVFRQRLFKSLLNEGFSQKQIEHVLTEYQTIQYTKTNNRSVLGSMNEFAFYIEVIIDDVGGIKNIDQMGLGREINRIIMSAIDYEHSIDVLRNKLEQIK